MFAKDLVKGLTIYATLFLVVGPVMWLSDSIAPAYYMGPIVAVVLFLYFYHDLFVTPVKRKRNHSKFMKAVTGKSPKKK